MPSFFERLMVYAKQTIHRKRWRMMADATIEQLLTGEVKTCDLGSLSLAEVIASNDYCVVLLGRDVYENKVCRVIAVDYATAMACLRYRKDFRVGSHLSVVSIRHTSSGWLPPVRMNASDIALSHVVIDVRYGDCEISFQEALQPIRGLL